MSYIFNNYSNNNTTYIFEENLGQFNSSAKFILRKSNLILYFLPDRVTIDIIECIPDKQNQIRIDNPITYDLNNKNNSSTKLISTFDLLFTNCNINSIITEGEKLQTIFSYHSPSLKDNNITNVNTFSKITYNNIYPNIDLIFYSNGDFLEHDFIIKPNANPSDIHITLKNITEFKLNDLGDAELFINYSTLKLKKPSAYQLIDNTTKDINSNFICGIDEFNDYFLKFELSHYDTSKELIIDPILYYSTLFEPGNITHGNGIITDPYGNSYVTGYTDLASSNPSFKSIFISKYDPKGILLKTIYIYGESTSINIANAIAIDNSSNIYITGFTTANQLTKIDTFLYDSFNGLDAAFIIKLDNTLDNILYSAIVHGNGRDIANSIVVDASSNAYITGITLSSNISGSNIVAPTPLVWSAFVLKLNTAGDAPIYFAYIGGDNYTYGICIYLDYLSNPYITGLTLAQNFPGTIIQDPANNSVAAYVMAINDDGTNYLYSSYINGNNSDSAYGLVLDNNNNVYITGNTSSTVFPGYNTPLIDGPNGDLAMFVMKLPPDLSSVLYSAYIHGNGIESGYSIVLDPLNNAYITGYSSSSNYAITNSYGVSPNNTNASVVTQINPTGDEILFSAYLNGTNSDYGSSISIDNYNNIYVTGYTLSSDFPTLRAEQPTFIGSQDAFVLKFATEEYMLGLIYDELTNSTYGLEEIKVEVETIENTVLDSTYGLQSIANTLTTINFITNNIESTLVDIYSNITSTTYGLAEIKYEVATIENTVLNPVYGLNAINNNLSSASSHTTSINSIVTSIYDDVSSSIYGLSVTKTEIASIEKGVLNPIYGLESINNSINNINTIINNYDSILTSVYNDINSPVFGLEEIKIEVATIEIAVLNPIYGLNSIENTLTTINNNVYSVNTVMTSIYNDINNPYFGLEEIKTEVATIENTVTNPIYGLESINNTVTTISSTVDTIDLIMTTIYNNINNPNYGLQEIQVEVATIENAVLSPIYGVESINNKVTSINETVSDINNVVINISNDITNPTYGLFEIKQEVRYIENQISSINIIIDDIISYLEYSCNIVPRPTSISTGFINKDRRTCSVVLNFRNNTDEIVQLDIVLLSINNNRLCEKSKNCTITLLPGSKDYIILGNVPKTYEIVIDNIINGIEAWVGERTENACCPVVDSCYIKLVYFCEKF